MGKIKSAPTDNPESSEIVTKDELLLGDWTPVRNEVWASSVLSDGAKLCYIAICSHIWKGKEKEAWPGQKRLANMLGVKDRSIRNYLRELEAVGIIQTIRHGLTKTNTYYICKPNVDVLKPLFMLERKILAAQERNKVAVQERNEIADKEQAVKEQSSKEQSEVIPIINDINISSPSIPESTKSVLSGALDEDELVIYVQTVVDYFNGLKGLYPNKVRSKITRPVKRITVDKYKDGKYRAIIKWYQQGIPAEYICDQLAKWIPVLKTSVGGSLNYFENKNIDYVNPDKKRELAELRDKLLEEYDAREQRDYGRIG